MKKLLTAMFVIFTASALAAQQPPSVDQPKITVTGEALVYAKPDKIVLNFGIETRDSQLLAAKRKNGDIWKKAAAVLKESGVPDKDVQTDYLSVEPRYRNYNEIDQPIGYVTRDMFVVTLSDPAKVESADLPDAGSRGEPRQRRRIPDHEFKQHRESARELALRRQGRRPKRWRRVGMHHRQAAGNQRVLRRRLLVLLQLVRLGLRSVFGGMSQNVIRTARIGRRRSSSRWPWARFRSVPVYP